MKFKQIPIIKNITIEAIKKLAYQKLTEPFNFWKIGENNLFLKDRLSPFVKISYRKSCNLRVSVCVCEDELEGEERRERKYVCA